MESNERLYGQQYQNSVYFITTFDFYIKHQKKNYTNIGNWLSMF